MSEESIPDYFEHAFNFLIQHEGGYVNNKKDKGGATNFGVSLRFLKSAGIDINHDGEVNEADILALNKEKARDVYRREWWDKYDFAKIKNKYIAAKIFDLAVNMGSATAVKILQKSINKLAKPPLVVDGIMGDKTIGMLNQLTDKIDMLLMNEIRRNAALYYMSLIQHNGDLQIFAKGWLRRAST